MSGCEDGFFARGKGGGPERGGGGGVYYVGRSEEVEGVAMG